jgi:hypothetical protein
LPWDEPLPDGAVAARWTWTQTTYSEYAAAAAFAAISSALAAAGAPIDLIGVAGDFVVDEIIHVEVSAKIAAALGGGVQLEVDLERLVRPATGTDPRLRAAELIVRTCCVGEALTVPLLDLSRTSTDSALIGAALRRIMRDEVAHAQLGGWFLGWADAWLGDEDRAHLGRVAGTALRAFAPLLDEGDSGESAWGSIASEQFNPAFVAAARRRVVEPLFAYGIEIPSADLRAVGAAGSADVTG